MPDLLQQNGKLGDDRGSKIVTIATNAPLLLHQLKRLAKRVPLGIGVIGGRGGNSSGDIFVVCG